MNAYTQVGSLQIATVLFDFVNQEALPGTGLDAELFWRNAVNFIEELSPINARLLQIRTDIQANIDSWHRSQRSHSFDRKKYRELLRRIGYLVPAPTQCSITTSNVDPELSSVAGPQLVVPALNARFALNAANSRWGSLYDALYGTDAIPETGGAQRGATYNPVRGDKVVAWARELLDVATPLAEGSHATATSYSIDEGALKVELASGLTTTLADPTKLIGSRGGHSAPTSVLMRNNGLHLEIRIDHDSPIGSTDAAGISDVFIESAVSTIVDFEDSVAAVDAADKVIGYRTWLGLNRGDLCENFTKNGESITRRMEVDRTFSAPDGSEVSLPGRSLLLVRNVGHLMTTPAMLFADGSEVPEGLVDALLTSLCGLHGLSESPDTGPLVNSRAGSIYIVKPKQHGPDEVSFTATVFRRVEEVLGLAPNTLKMGVMDEERRTTVNLAACIAAASERVVFINTGFLDRTGDEIHTSKEAGPMVPKAAMKNQRWLNAYEDWNMDVGLACGLKGRGQIGKGMWAMTDLMADMLDQKINHPASGANTAWVPSPTAAVLHATHYHKVNVREVQSRLSGQNRAVLDDILTIPTTSAADLSSEEIRAEVEDNCQSILGYVVRWVDAGIGCSKVPNIHNVNLMEDRATLRISSQLLANWIRHEVVSEDEMVSILSRVALVVDQQNMDDPSYLPMAANLDDSLAFQAAKELILEGADQPNGYTEPILHRYRRAKKAQSLPQNSPIVTS